MRIPSLKNALTVFFLLSTLTVSFASQRCVYWREVDDQIENKGIDPVKKICDLVNNNPTAACVRYSLKFTGERSYYMNDVLYERNKKTVTFYGFSIISGSRRKIYYRFYDIDKKLLAKWMKVSRSRSNSYSGDMDLFILWEMGVRVKNLRTGKFFTSSEQIPEY